MNKNLKEIEDYLLVIDMVNGFVKEGPLADPYISRLIPLQKKLIEYYMRESKREVAFVKESHNEQSREFKDFPPHCITGTQEAMLVDELIRYENKARQYLKNSTSVIFAPNFLDDLEKLKSLKRLIITGCCTDICVLNAAIPLINYFNQKDKDVEVVVPQDLVETYHIPHVHEREAYNNMAFTLMNQAGVNTEMPKDIQKVLTR